MHKRPSKALAIVFFAGQMGSALADRSHDFNSQLKGKYRFTYNQTCTYSQSGFSTDPPKGDVLGFASSGEDFIQGVMKFNGDGTMSLAEKGIYQNHGTSFPASFPITTYADVCSGKYQVNADLSFSYELDCTTTFITGFFTGQTVSVSGIKVEGQLDRWRESFIASGVSDTVQIQHFSDGHTNPRICASQASAIKIPQ